jgi:hypothetical protein
VPPDCQFLNLANFVRTNIEIFSCISKCDEFIMVSIENEADESLSQIADSALGIVAGKWRF